VSILVSGHFIRAGKVGGAETMLYNLLRGLWLNRVPFDLVLSNEENLDQAFRRELTERMKRQIRTSGGAGPRFIAEQRSCLDRGLSGEAILFPNYFTPPVIPRRFGRIVTVIHDFQFRHFPQYTTRRKRLWLRFAHGLTFRRADVVVVLSDFARQDAVRLYGALALRKMVVIPNPISWERLANGEVQASGGRPYILAVASQYPHKNLETLVRAFSIVRSRVPDVDLVIAGQHRSELIGQMVGGCDLEELAISLGLDGQIHFTGHIGDRDLAGLYHNAALFAFPSLFEGFGMPPVEALGLGIPTLTTKCASLPEVTLRGAHYVNGPQDAEEWADRIQAMLEHRQDFEVSPATVAAVRERYAPERIGKLYAEALLNRDFLQMHRSEARKIGRGVNI
jgi:glycosyltransferase involved in cell wall biosynthesis